jgi:hypothetical protein
MSKNPDLKNLRVAVVPTETGNGIDQSSSVEEILACDETELYTIPDYFKAQNDEEFGLHWSILINIETKADLTGMNTDGVDYFSKELKIAEIKKIILTWDVVCMGELTFCDHSPCISSIGNGKDNISQLIEEFRLDYVQAITYNDELVLNEEMIDYEDLSDELIDEIHGILKQHDKLMIDEEWNSDEI